MADKKSEQAKIEDAAKLWLLNNGSWQENGFIMVWVEQDSTATAKGLNVYQVGAQISSGGIMGVGDPKGVKYASVEKMCAYLKDQGYPVAPSREIKKRSTICIPPIGGQ